MSNSDDFHPDLDPPPARPDPLRDEEASLAPSTGAARAYDALDEEPTFASVPPDPDPTPFPPPSGPVSTEPFPRATEPPPVAPPAEQSFFQRNRTCLLLGVGGGLLLFCVLPCMVIALLTLMGPQIGNVFSEVSSDLATPAPDSGDLPSGVDTSVMELEVGDCLNDPSDSLEGTIGQLEVVPCAGPHDREIFASLIHPAGADEPFPGDEALDAFWEDRCVEAFEEFVGIAYDESALYLSTLEPTEGSWESGDREVLCLLYEPDTTLEGSMQDAQR